MSTKIILLGLGIISGLYYYYKNKKESFIFSRSIKFNNINDIYEIGYGTKGDKKSLYLKIKTPKKEFRFLELKKTISSTDTIEYFFEDYFTLKFFKSNNDFFCKLQQNYGQETVGCVNSESIKDYEKLLVDKTDFDLLYNFFNSI